MSYLYCNNNNNNNNNNNDNNNSDNNNNNNNNNNNKTNFLLHMNKKNLFLLPTPTEVVFNATILSLTLQDSILQQSILAKLFKSSEDY